MVSLVSKFYVMSRVIIHGHMRKPPLGTNVIMMYPMVGLKIEKKPILFKVANSHPSEHSSLGVFAVDSNGVSEGQSCLL